MTRLPPLLRDDHGLILLDAAACAVIACLLANGLTAAVLHTSKELPQPQASDQAWRLAQILLETAEAEDLDAQLEGTALTWRVGYEIRIPKAP